MDKKELSFKGKMELTTAIEYLESLIASMKEKTIVIQKGAESISLNLADLVKLEVEAKKKEDKMKERLMIEISWDHEVHTIQESELKIQSSKPLPDLETFESAPNELDD